MTQAEVGLITHLNHVLVAKLKKSMNLKTSFTNLRTYLRNHRGVLIVILLTILVIIGIILRLLTPTRIPIDTQNTKLPSLNNETFTITSTRYTGLSLTIPSTLAYYQVRPLSSNEITSKIATSYNLTPHPVVQNFWISSDKQTTLSVNEQGLITFATTTSSPAMPANYSIQQAVNTAYAQLATFGLDPKIFKVGSTKYLSGEGEELLSTANPTFLEIKLIPQVNEYPLIYSSQTEPFNIFYLNANYVINKAIFSPISFDIISESRASTLTLDQAIEQINLGNLTVINVYSDITNPTVDLDLERINFTKVILEYRFNPSTNTILPYFHFTGVEDNDLGRQNIEVITPAIVTE